jgi:mono/diheme cytochrome c family protein
MLRSLTVLLLLALALVVVGAACGGDDDDSGADTTTTEQTTTDETTTDDDGEAAGRDIFAANCGSCHALSDAGTSGTVGPALDGNGLSSDQIAEQVRNGGGGMPAFADTLDDDEIEAVAEYVAGQ